MQIIPANIYLMTEVLPILISFFYKKIDILAIVTPKAHRINNIHILVKQ